jgi:hypothetical protein
LGVADFVKPLQTPENRLELRFENGGVFKLSQQAQFLRGDWRCRVVKIEQVLVGAQRQPIAGVAARLVLINEM